MAKIIYLLSLVNQQLTRMLAGKVFNSIFVNKPPNMPSTKPKIDDVFESIFVNKCANEENTTKKNNPVFNTLDITAEHSNGKTNATVDGTYNHIISDVAALALSHSIKFDHRGKQIHESTITYTYDLNSNADISLSLINRIGTRGKHRTDFHASFKHNINYNNGGSGSSAINASRNSVSVKCGINL